MAAVLATAAAPEGLLLPTAVAAEEAPLEGRAAGLSARLLLLALVPLLLLWSMDSRLPLAASLRALLAAVGANRRLLAPERGEVTGDLTAALALLAVVAAPALPVAAAAAPAVPAAARGEVTGDLKEPPVLAVALLLRP